MAKFTREILWHFRCDACTRWWSIADFDENHRGYMACPWCHALQEYEEVKDDGPDELMGK